MPTRRLLIHGRVQGVGYRDALCDEARRRGVQGWVRNRRDGTVEAVVDGDAAAVEAISRWATIGPPLARVVRVVAEDISEAPPAGFRRLPTA